MFDSMLKEVHATRTGRRTGDQGLHVHRRLDRHHRQVLDDGVRPDAERAMHAELPGDAGRWRRRLSRPATSARRGDPPGRGHDRDHAPLRRRQDRATAAGLRRNARHRRASTRRWTGAWFEILSKPVFLFLDFYAGYQVGGFGLAHPGADHHHAPVPVPGVQQASYAMSTKMKKVQPR